MAARASWPVKHLISSLFQPPWPHLLPIAGISVHHMRHRTYSTWQETSSKAALHTHPEFACLKVETGLTSSATNARMGDRSKVPPMGGMIPLQAHPPLAIYQPVEHSARENSWGSICMVDTGLRANLRAGNLPRTHRRHVQPYGLLFNGSKAETNNSTP